VPIASSPLMMKLNLKDVTICAADSVTPVLAARAIDKSNALCDFGDAILFTDIPQPDGLFRNVKIDRLTSRQDYSKFILKGLVHHIHTKFVLIVQWDGYVLDESAWQPAFTDFDLIGARWHWHKDGMTVGNGGFTLRSKKLLEAMNEPCFPLMDDMPEDVLICRFYRQELEKKVGIRFATDAVADAFSYERALPDAPTFGFHGLFNMWRHVEDDEMSSIAEFFSPHLFREREFFELLAQYFLLRKFSPLKVLYYHLKQNCRQDEILSIMVQTFKNKDFADYCFRVCENLYASDN
jgi:hypothetical protein